ncbi:MAG: helix-turn-helix transcriptional regulator [Ruminococcaceae bacterium]|nr:helix-turn-helix transcriptional regulator [Oscillospiraceae bacterium]
MAYLHNVQIAMHCYHGSHTTGVTNTFKEHCFGYIFDGSVRILLPSGELCASAGDLLYISQESQYYSIWSGEPDICFLSVQFGFANRSTHAGLGLQIVRGMPKEPFLRLYETHRNHPMAALSAMYEILGELYENRLTTPHRAASRTLPAQRYIESHTHEVIAVETLAGLCGMSASHFHAVFRREIGLTPVRYRHTLLVQEAMKLLLRTNLSVEEISDRLGFSSSCYFRRVFSGITGKTPLEIRE